MIETFEPWFPIRSGGTALQSETLAIGRKKDTDHYIPVANDRPSYP